MWLIILGFLFLALALAGIIFYHINISRLNRLSEMSSGDMLRYVCTDEDTRISVAILRDGELTYHVYGKDGELPGDALYDYEIGSLSKTFVGLLAAKAVQEGRLELDAPISKYLPLDRDGCYPTVERLLTHTSGYKSYYFEVQMIKNKLSGKNDFYGISTEKLLNRVRSIRLEDRDYPFSYSNFGLSVMGLVLESVYGRDFVSLMNEFLEGGLQLKHTSTAGCSGNLAGYWSWKKDDGYIPAGAIISNIRDMGAYLKLLAAGEAEYIQESFRSLKKINVHHMLYEKIGISMDEAGMTWMIDTHNHLIWHNGGTGGFNSYLALDRDSGTGVVILGNLSPSRKIPMTVIGVRLMRELREDLK